MNKKPQITARTLFLALLLVSLALAACGEKEWQRFSSPQGDFAVLFPGEPRQEKRTAQSRGLSLEVYIVGFEDSASYYGVVCTEYPDDQALPTKAAAEKTIKAVLEGTVKGMQAEILSRKAVSLEGHPGREVTFRIPEGKRMPQGTGRIRVYLVGRWVYQVLTLTNKELSPEDHDKFLDSFELLSP